MQIFFKTLNGKTLSIRTRPESTIEELKCKVSAIGGIPPEKYELSFGGRRLDNNETLDFIIFKRNRRFNWFCD